MDGPNKVTSTAPLRIYLRISDDANDVHKPFPQGTYMDWGTSPTVACEVEYVRADVWEEELYGQDSTV